MSRVVTLDQTSDLWLAAHAGRITASCFPALLAPPTTRQSTRGGVVCPAGTEAAEKASLRRELVVERITGENVPHPVTEYMKDGQDREDSARQLYGILTDQSNNITVVGFCLHPIWDWFGASPDGLCGDTGGVELKCPAAMTHDGYAQDINLLVEKYKGQVLGNLICFPEREWWDLCSFHPLFPPDYMLLTAPRFHRSDWAETIARIEDEAQTMNAQVEAEIARRGLPPTVWGIMPGN
jgi:hypothetical protein